jgi:hypothetical protein
MTAAPRYTVRTDKISQRFRIGLDAWINDADHPDDPQHGASISWHQSVDDARRVCDALNAMENWARALRAQIGEAA